MKFVYIILAFVLLGIGSILIPPIRDVSTAIFSMFGGTEGMDPFLELMVTFWPLWLLSIFVFGAYMLTRGGSQ